MDTKNGLRNVSKRLMTFLSSGNRSWIRLEGEEMAIEKVFVVGSGLMGGGIAQVCAQVGIQVFISDISQEILNKALKNIS